MAQGIKDLHWEILTARYAWGGSDVLTAQTAVTATTLSVTATSAATTLDAKTKSVVMVNAGSDKVFIKFWATSDENDDAWDVVILSGERVHIAIPSTITQVAYACATGETATLYLTELA